LPHHHQITVERDAQRIAQLNKAHIPGMAAIVVRRSTGQHGFTGRDAVTGKPTLAAFCAKGRYMDNLTVEDDRFERNNQ